MLLLSLIGEQPIPNLLPIRFLQPDENLFVYTDRTEAVARRLQRLLTDSAELNGHLKVAPFDYARTLAQMLAAAGGRPGLTINLTGGTKIMALAAHALAVQTSSPFLYLQSEGSHSLLYRYTWAGGEPVWHPPQVLPPLITAEEYLLAHLPGYSAEGFHRDEHGELDAGGRFEQAVYNALLPALDQALAGVRPAGVGNQIEIDLVLRCGNRVGIAEVKIGRGKFKSSKESTRRALDQLKMAGEPNYLGAYTTQFLISAAPKIADNARLLATERRVAVILLPSYQDGQPLDPDDAASLAAQLRVRLA